MNTTKQNKNSSFPVIMGIIWGIIISMSVWITVSILTYEIEPYRSNDLLLNSICSEAYGKLYNSLSYDLKDGLSVKKNPEYKEMIATAGYIEAAGQYRMYKENNMESKAAYYEKKMQDYRSDMGRLGYLTEKIVKYFKKGSSEED